MLHTTRCQFKSETTGKNNTKNVQELHIIPSHYKFKTSNIQYITNMDSKKKKNSWRWTLQHGPINLMSKGNTLPQMLI